MKYTPIFLLVLIVHWSLFSDCKEVDQTVFAGKWHLHKEPPDSITILCCRGQGSHWNPIITNEENREDHCGGGVDYKGFSSDY